MGIIGVVKGMYIYIYVCNHGIENGNYYLRFRVVVIQGFRVQMGIRGKYGGGRGGGGGGVAQ